MRSVLAYAFAGLIIALSWPVLCVMQTLNGWGRVPIAPADNPAAFVEASRKTLAETTVANAVIVLIENGAVFDTLTYSIGTPVSEDSVFQIASLSKWVTATGVMALAEDGLIQLDAPVSSYLASWTLPQHQYDEDEISIRRLLSHTAGLTDDLGYIGYEDIANRQSLPASLTQASDAMPDATGRVEIGQRPGKSFRYSGGGYTLLQLMIEDVTGLSFDQYMRGRVLLPLGMTDSAFEPGRPLLDRLVMSYTEDGKTVPTARFTALAAASLFTTPRDMTAFVLAHLSQDGLRTSGAIVLSSQYLFEMREPHANVFNREVYGLGTLLSAKTKSGAFVFGHDGHNSPAISTAVRINPDTSDAIIIFSTGDPAFAAKLASEWTFWQLGRPDISELNSRLRPLALRAALHATLAFLLFTLILLAIKYWRQRSARIAAK